MTQSKTLGLLKIKTFSETLDTFTQTLDFIGVNYLSIVGGERKGGLDSLTVFYSSYPRKWAKHYHKENFLERDPVLQELLDPSKSMYFCEASDPKLQFMNKCKDFDIHYKLAFFVRDPKWHYSVVFSFKESCDEILKSPLQRHLFETLSTLLASKVHSKIDSSPPALTGREIECLKWASEGRTAEEIGIILSLSHWTVTFHLKNTYKKLGVYSKTAAILKAIKSGLL